jgi:hypothetical protein
VAEEDRISEVEADPIRDREGRLHLARALEPEQREAGGQVGQGEPVRTCGPRRDEAAALAGAEAGSGPLTIRRCPCRRR